MADELTPGQRRYRDRQERLREEGRQEERLRSREETVNRREGALNRPSSGGGGGVSRPDPSLAVVALTIAGGVIFYDLARGSAANGHKLSDQEKLSAGLAYGLGAMILLGISEALPQLGVPLSMLLMLSVLVGRPQALQLVTRIASNAAQKSLGQPQTSGFPTLTQSAGSTAPVPTH